MYSLLSLPVQCSHRGLKRIISDVHVYTCTYTVEPLIQDTLINRTHLAAPNTLCVYITSYNPPPPGNQDTSLNQDTFPCPNSVLIIEGFHHIIYVGTCTCIYMCVCVQLYSTNNTIVSKTTGWVDGKHLCHKIETTTPFLFLKQI